MRSLGERLSLAGVGMIVLALVVFGWIGYELSKWPGEPPSAAGAAVAADSLDEGAEETEQESAEAGSAEPSPTPTAPARPQRFALLSDGLAVLEGSWFNRVIRSRSVPDVVPGAIASQPGSTAAALAPRAQQAAKADVLLVQGGTLDLLNGSAPQAVITSVQDLLQTAIDLGGPNGGPEVVWVTVPPLGAQPANVLSVNEAVTAWAEDNDVVVWDLTSPVATPTGAWRPGFTVDGIAASVQGQEAQAKAARRLANQTLQQLSAG
jgi:hypothetical protein